MTADRSVSEVLAAAEEGGWRARVAVACGVVIAVVVLIPGLVPTFVNPWLETDPRVEGLPEALGGMTGTMAVGLQVVGMVAAGIGMGVSRGLRTWWLLLAGFGCVGALGSVMMGAGSTGNRVMVGSWVAGVVMAVGMASLVADRGHGVAVRRWVVAALVAGLVPLTVDALWQVLVEHPQNVRFFERTMDEMLAARGWVERSPEHLLFERRMMFSDATGGYALSNVLGSVGAGLACLGLGFVGLRLRDRGTLTAVGVVLMGGVLVWLTASRGAMGAMVLGLVWFGLVWWLGGRIKRAWLRGVVVGGLGVGMVLVPWLAIGWAGLQGAPPPPGEGEALPGWLSLLFRYWYLEAGVRMLVEVPGVWWMAVGPQGFALMFGWMKDPMLPEEVASTHNVVIDLLVMLGVYGLCWLVLGGWWLWRAICPPALDEGEPQDLRGGEPNWLGGLVVAGLLLMPVTWVLLPTLLVETAFLQLVVFGGYAVAVAWLAEVGRGVSGRVMGMGLAAGALVLVVHGQMEMTFFNGGASQLAWMVLGLAGGVGAGVNVRIAVWLEKLRGIVKLGYGPGFLVAYALLVAIPISRIEAGSVEVARFLVQGEPDRAIGVMTKDEFLYLECEEWQAWAFRLGMEKAHAGVSLNDEAIVRDGYSEALRSIPLGDDADLKKVHRRFLDLGLFMVDHASYFGNNSVERNLGILTRAHHEHAGPLVAFSPYSVRTILLMVDLKIRMGEYDLAYADLEAARRINAGLYLDPLKQLPAERFEGLAERIAVGRGGG